MDLVSGEPRVNILLVDDHPENLLALEAILEAPHLNLIRASSGEEALKWLLREEFALILLDVQMPGLSGFEVAELIKQREKTRHIPIIFLTAINKDSHFVFKGYSVGAVDYMFKPFEPNILRSKVEVFVDLYLKTAKIQQQTRQLRTQKTFNELVLNSAGEGIFGLDLDGCFTFMNPIGCKMVGFEVGELIGARVHDLVHHSRPDGAPYHMEDCFIQAAYRAGETCQVSDEVFWRKDGSCFPVEYVSTPIHDAGRITGAVVMFRDITERKRSEVEIARRTHELEQANQRLLEADRYKDEFLSVISHELRTPLNFITGFASILDDEVAGPLSEDQHAFIQKILTGADRMLNLVNDLLDFAKIQAGKFELYREPMDMGMLIDESVASLRPLADKKHLTLGTRVEGLLLAKVDAQRIIQLLDNLVGNAIKFTPEGGSVEIRAFRSGDTVVTEVVDTGVGIARDDLAKLFAPFKQLDMSSTREAGGTGLGLSISKALVDAHGGTIEVWSEGLGAGACFRFALPAMVEPAKVEWREGGVTA